MLRLARHQRRSPLVGIRRFLEPFGRREHLAARVVRHGGAGLEVHGPFDVLERLRVLPFLRCIEPTHLPRPRVRGDFPDEVGREPLSLVMVAGVERFNCGLEDFGGL